MKTQEVKSPTPIPSIDEVISNYDLQYTHEFDLAIVRKKQGKKFVYFKSGKEIQKKKELERIQSLVIPPIWDDVKISCVANSHLQAVGRDIKNRKQYIYHPQWNKLRNKTKFYKMHAFGKKLPVLRKQIETDLNKRGWPKEKVIALVIRLMEVTHIRIGNSYYEKENKSYGLTTLRKRHITMGSNKMKIQFVGKKGKEHTITVRNKKLIRLVNRCEELPGWELFKYIDENGERKTIKSHHINEYLQEICGAQFTAKDFRTWSGSVTFFDSLLELEKAESEDEIKKNILKAYEQTAKALGNTKTVCRKYYVHPVIVKGYEDGKLNRIFNKVKKSTTIDSYFSPSETEILKLFKKYELS
ncbi:DNA topoisomerase IB [Flavobacterium sp. UMI-01]|uniref:DNA topoisomerase IB n=1 Tax=Flavobacterium sp. UMI-01 TaxID=1441053 RepID=UPI001C7D4CA9|nr:DNA topoisomerase IB [Flavobacterium sp. UMI-01]GIZ08177.1 DNA topoisomerase [Flavobacterium sp. UMI-01]